MEFPIFPTMQLANNIEVIDVRREKYHKFKGIVARYLQEELAENVPVEVMCAHRTDDKRLRREAELRGGAVGLARFEEIKDQRYSQVDYMGDRAPLLFLVMQNTKILGGFQLYGIKLLPPQGDLIPFMARPFGGLRMVEDRRERVTLIVDIVEGFFDLEIPLPDNQTAQMTKCETWNFNNTGRNEQGDQVQGWWTSELQMRSMRLDITQTPNDGIQGRTLQEITKRDPGGPSGGGGGGSGPGGGQSGPQPAGSIEPESPKQPKRNK
jgi:hypothetical protein